MKKLIAIAFVLVLVITQSALSTSPSSQCDEYPEQVQFIGNITSSIQSEENNKICLVEIKTNYEKSHYFCEWNQNIEDLLVPVKKHDSMCPEINDNISGVLMLNAQDTLIFDGDWFTAKN